MWKVYAYFTSQTSQTGYQDGKGSSIQQLRDFDDLPTAKRWAKDMVETKGAMYARVSEVKA